jgi:hypothetical protein
MTILFVGSEQEAFSLVGASNITLNTTSSYFQSAYSRGSIKIVGTSYAGTAFNSQTELWVHDTVAFGVTVQPATSSSRIFRLVNSSSVECVKLTTLSGVPEINSVFRVGYWNGSSFTYLNSPFVPSQNTTYDIDLHVRIASFGGVVEFYIDGVLVSSFSGDTSAIGSGITKVELSSKNEDNTSYHTHHSQLIISTSTTLGMKVATLSVSGAGATSEWTGLYTDVSETVLSDINFISDNTNGDISTYAVTDVPAGGNFNVGAIVVSARAERGVTGVQNLELGVRSGGANYWGSPVTGLTTAFGPAQSILTTDPATGLPWTVANANAVEIGVQALT